jgi:hypothetical protein
MTCADQSGADRVGTLGVHGDCMFAASGLQFYTMKKYRAAGHSQGSLQMKNPLVALALLALAGAASAAPVPITGLYNTGVNNASALLSLGTVDPHYILTVNPNASTPSPYVSSNAVVITPASGWVANDSTSQWIGPANNLTGCGDCNYGLFTYSLTFSLAGLNPATAQISGLWSADDIGSKIVLNGIDAVTSPVPVYGALAAFSITSGFTAGLNTLSFIVSNRDEGPTGLLVRNLLGTAEPTPVPIPAAVWLLGSGLLGLFAIGRRRGLTAA